MIAGYTIYETIIMNILQYLIIITVILYLTTSLAILSDPKLLYNNYNNHDIENEDENKRHQALVLPRKSLTFNKNYNKVTTAIEKTKTKIKKAIYSNSDNKGILPYTINPSLIPEDRIPLLCFVNSKSGGQQGKYIKSQLIEYLSNYQVFDLTECNPITVLKEFSKLTRVKVLVCGGDGTIGWVLNSIQSLKLHDITKISVAILPLGTGNDLALELGWAHCFETNSFSGFLDEVSKAQMLPMDRWELSIENNNNNNTNTNIDSTEIDNNISIDSDSSHTRQSRSKALSLIINKLLTTSYNNNHNVKKFNNYLGIGIDAQIVHQFHQMRIHNPTIFISNWINKIIYGYFGLQNLWKQDFINFNNYIKLYCDGEEITLPDDTQGIVFVNIASYGGGSRLWYNDNNSKSSSRRSSASEDSNYNTLTTNNEEDDAVQASVRGGYVGESAAYHSTWKDIWAPLSSSDGLLEVVAIRGTLELASVKVLGKRSVHKLAQGRKFKVAFNPSSQHTSSMPVQCDGEPWLQVPSTLHISATPEQVMMLRPCPGAIDRTAIEVLDWAQHRGVINSKQYMLIMNKYAERAQKDSNKNSFLGI